MNVAQLPSGKSEDVMLTVIEAHNLCANQIDVNVRTEAVAFFKHTHLPLLIPRRDHLDGNSTVLAGAHADAVDRHNAVKSAIDYGKSENTRTIKSLSHGELDLSTCDRVEQKERTSEMLTNVICGRISIHPPLLQTQATSRRLESLLA